MTSVPESEYWRRCNSCKKNLPYSGKYWVCNVSTCNRKRTGMVFCSVSCWDAHVPVMNHRESWAEERKAPSKEEWAKILTGEDKPARKRTPETPSVQDAKPAAPSQAPRVILRRSGSGNP